MPSPRSTLFPYTTLFRSADAELTVQATGGHISVRIEGDQRWEGDFVLPSKHAKRSEERFSRNAEPEIYTLSLHDALPICGRRADGTGHWRTHLGAYRGGPAVGGRFRAPQQTRKEIGRAVQQECRARDLHSFPTRRSSDLRTPS